LISAGPGIPAQVVFKSLIQEFTSMDERMTNQMVTIQQNAVNLGLLAQKLEDDSISSITGTSSGSKQKHFFGLRKKKSGTGGLKPSEIANSSTFTSTLDHQR
jgi:hypothetical protein